MKKIASVFIIICVAAVAFMAKAEFRYGPTAGVAITNLKFKQDLMTVDGSIGPQVGVTGELMFPGIGLGIDISALYSMEGAKLHLGERKIWAVDGYATERAYLHYLEIPLNLRFKWTRMNGIEDYFAPFVFGGPTFSFLCGHSDIKAFDFAGGVIGLQAGLGFELFRNWQIQGSYVWGMTYALKAVKLQNFSAQNRFWSIRATYFF